MYRFRLFSPRPTFRINLFPTNLIWIRIGRTTRNVLLRQLSERFCNNLGAVVPLGTIVSWAMLVFKVTYLAVWSDWAFCRMGNFEAFVTIFGPNCPNNLSQFLKKGQNITFLCWKMPRQNLGCSGSSFYSNGYLNVFFSGNIFASPDIWRCSRCSTTSTTSGGSRSGHQHQHWSPTCESR